MLKIEHFLILLTGNLLWQLIAAFEVVEESNNECVNCTRYNGICNFKGFGWSAFTSDNNDSNLVVELPYDELEEVSLHDCVDEDFRINGTIEMFICFWSRRLGCQGVHKKGIVNVDLMNRIICNICYEYCGCKTPKTSASIKYDGHNILTVCMIIRLIT